MRGKPVELRYALALDCDDPYRLADDVLLPLETVLSLGGGPRPAGGERAGGPRRRGQRTPSRGRRTRGAGLQPDAQPDRGVVSRSYRVARRPARLPRGVLRRLVRATTLRHRHRQVPRRLSPGARLALSSRSPTPRSSSRSRRTSESRSQRTLRRRSAAAPVPSASWPTRPHHHSCTRPRSFNSRGRRACAVNWSGASCSRRRVELVGHQHGPGVADVHNPVCQIHGRPEVVAIPQQHRPTRQAHPHVRQEVVVGVGVGQAEPDPRRRGDAVDHEHDLVADHLDHAAPGHWSRCHGRSPRSAARRRRAPRRSDAGSGA